MPSPALHSPPGAAQSTLGLLLAGGQSVRLGVDKAKLEIPGTGITFAENARRLLAEAGLPILVAAKSAERAHELIPDSPAVADGPGHGPAAAILGAHLAYPAADLLVLACDLPALPPALLRFVRDLPGDLVLPAWTAERDPSSLQLEPLCALYRRPALECLARRVAAGTFDLRGLAQEPTLRIRRVTDQELRLLGSPATMFCNVNHPADLAALAATRHPPLPP